MQQPAPQRVSLEYIYHPKGEPSQSLGVKSAARKWDPIRREHEHLFSRKYYCLFCGHIYGEVRVTPAMLWSCEMGVCGSCPQGHLTELIPGSVLKYYSLSHLNSLPEGVVQHEFNIHMQWALKEYENEFKRSANPLDR